MRHISFIAAFAVLLAAPSVAGSTRTSLAGVGTFSYSGSPIAAPASVLVVAGLSRADRS
ncbi:MAG: hypothetical protein JWQ51_1707 [Tardiphaga sp.]|nr:hypothetical protein [Tardiphaga sp.]MDB5629367.1 hypothetical protein [Tardiphaga sp.]